MAPNSRDLLFAYRWPAALVISSAFLAAALLKLLSQPIPNPDRWRLNIDPLVIPSTVTIRTNEPLPVQAGLVGDGDAPQKGEQPIRISGPVTVRGDVDAAVRCPVPSPSARMTLWMSSMRSPIKTSRCSAA